MVVSFQQGLVQSFATKKMDNKSPDCVSIIPLKQNTGIKYANLLQQIEFNNCCGRFHSFSKNEDYIIIMTHDLKINLSQQHDKPVYTVAAFAIRFLK